MRGYCIRVSGRRSRAMPPSLWRGTWETAILLQTTHPPNPTIRSISIVQTGLPAAQVWCDWRSLSLSHCGARPSVGAVRIDTWRRRLGSRYIARRRDGGLSPNMEWMHGIFGRPRRVDVHVHYAWVVVASGAYDLCVSGPIPSSGTIIGLLFCHVKNAMLLQGGVVVVSSRGTGGDARGIVAGICCDWSLSTYAYLCIPRPCPVGTFLRP